MDVTLLKIEENNKILRFLIDSTISYKISLYQTLIWNFFIFNWLHFFYFINSNPKFKIFLFLTFQSYYLREWGDISRKKLQHTMPGNTNVFDYLTKVKQRSRQWRDTASLVFTVWTLVGDSTSCPGLATTGARGLSMLLRVVAFTMLILKINLFLRE